MKRVFKAGQEDQCIQRQELRLRDNYLVETDRPVIYSLRFRTPEPVHDTTHSIRWITAQWKQTTIRETYAKEIKDKDPSWDRVHFSRNALTTGCCT